MSAEEPKAPPPSPPSSFDDPLAVFDFTEAEEAVVNSLLEIGAQSVSKLSRTADLPRTTVHSVLARLKERGLVRRKSGGYASVWGLVSSPKLRKRLAMGAGHLDRELSVEELEAELGVKVSETAQFFIIRGVDAMLHVYQWMMINHYNQRVCGIQPRASMEAIFAKLPPEQVAQLNDAVKHNRVIIDAVLPESIRQVYRTLFKGHSKLAESVEGRAMSAHLVKDKFLSFSSDLVIGKDAALLANWDEEALVLIKNPDMVALLQHLFEILREEGKATDHNALVRAVIADAH